MWPFRHCDVGVTIGHLLPGGGRSPLAGSADMPEVGSLVGFSSRNSISRWAWLSPGAKVKGALICGVIESLRHQVTTPPSDVVAMLREHHVTPSRQ